VARHEDPLDDDPGGAARQGGALTDAAGRGGGKRPPLGASVEPRGGVRFSLYSGHATAVDLCLFASADAAEESARIPMERGPGGVWQAFLAEARPGQLYGYRADGPFAPEEGQRFNPAKLLLDPYARALTGSFTWNDALLGYTRDHLRTDLSRDHRDSAGFMPKCRVIDPTFPWDDDQPPAVPWDRTVIYEAHVRGLTRTHPRVPEMLRGRYLGIASEPVVEHLVKLGITAIELLPVHAFMTDGILVERGLTNYWGYQSLGFFAPEARYASGSEGEQVTEFRQMVRALHRAGIEVILDVVYNHTAEGNQLGPTVSFRGLDNPAYYRLVPEHRRYYQDFTGCGNTLDVTQPAVLDLILDSLRYWVEGMHVDGFRFDLAPVLGRGAPRFDPHAELFRRIAADPVLARVKLIAEPWDVGDGGWQQGNFPAGWAEWNGWYRDSVRKMWRGDRGSLGDAATRLIGSPDLFSPRERGPLASVNFVTCHDGFTLQDLVSYERKQNLANGEENRDGTSDNHSSGWGAEGPTGDAEIVALRDRLRRNFFATLAFSQGVPMFSQGDELGHTQSGNNNAYCQDNATSWVNWEIAPREADLLAFVRHVLALRRQHAALRRRTYFRASRPEEGATDLQWLRADGREMAAADWSDPRARVLAMMFRGEPEGASPTGGATFLLLLNPDVASHFVHLPRLPRAGSWVEMVNTARSGERLVSSDGLNLVAHSLILLRHGPAR